MGQVSEDVAVLMGRFRLGDREAAGRLIDLFYPRLKQIAAGRMARESGPHTWQATALVNELYLELVKIRALRASAGSAEEEREAFLKLSSHLMKRLLIHHARPLARQARHEEFQEESMAGIAGAQELQEVENLLDRLAEIDPQLRTVVELRVFEGLSGPDVAQRLGCSARSEARHWHFARNWLAREMQ